MPEQPSPPVEERTVTLSDGRVFAADLVVGAIGVRPDVRLAELAGLDLGPSGGITVNEANRTNDLDIYAVGDAVEKADAISHATSLIALANVANRQGRRVADHIAGRRSHAVASLGTAIVKVFDLVAATVGWNERRLQAPAVRFAQSTRTPSTTPPTTPARPAWQQSSSSIRAMERFSVLRSLAGTVSTRGSM